jgi:methyl-accepting chemotaxis protein
VTVQLLNLEGSTAMSVKLKLFAAFAGVVLLTVALGVVSMLMLGSVNGSATTVARNGVAAETSLATVGQIYNKLRKDQIHYFISVGQYATTRGDIEGDLADMAAALKSYRGGTAAERQAMRGFASAFLAYADASRPMFQLVAGGKTQAAETLVGDGGAADSLWDPVKGTYATWQGATTKAVDADLASARSTYSTARLVVIGLVALAALLGAILAFVLGRRLSRDIGQLVTAADGIASGDVEQTVAIRSRDELGRLGDSFTEMIDYLRGSAAVAERIADGDLTVHVEPRSEHDRLGSSFVRMVENLRTTLGRVSHASAGMSAASQAMASTSADAGSAVNEIARAVGDVASGAERQARMVESARSSTEETTQAAGEARSVSQEGVTAANDASKAMASVRDASAAVSAAIAQLAEKSEQIGGIVATITGIAGQTNLLALNAAIEAARAGEQGKGFAVVAEEVRKLAEESQQAAATIADLIEQMQTETASAVATVEDGARRSEEGVAIVERARDAFLRIGTAVEDMTARIGEIGSAVGEVATLAEQSSATAQEVSASTEETSASAQELADTARAIAATAGELEQLVGGFRLGEPTLQAARV